MSIFDAIALEAGREAANKIIGFRGNFTGSDLIVDAVARALEASLRERGKLTITTEWTAPSPQSHKVAHIRLGEKP